MQIKKINNDKLKVILSLSDLDQKNINVDSFLSKSIESQDLFFEILDLAEEKYGFDIEDSKAIVEAISLDNNIFILTITKIKNEVSNNTYNSSFKIYCFDNIDTLLNIYSIMRKINVSHDNIEIYAFSDKYYLILKEDNIVLENLLAEYSHLINNYEFLEDILFEYGKKIE